LVEPLDVERLRIARMKAAVDARLSELLPGPDASTPLLDAATREALLSPGKRLRPVLCMLAAWHLGADELAALDPACSVEMVHAASLVLDDLPCMDDARTRRGAPAIHVQFGEEIATLAGVGLLNQAYAVLADAAGLSAQTRLDMLRVLTAAVGFDGLVGGQARDLGNNGAPSLEKLTDLHRRKTAPLFLAAVQLGAVVAGAAEAETAVLLRFAAELGLGIQAVDDFADGQEGCEDVGRSSLVSLIGADGALNEARRRFSAARSALTEGGAELAMLGTYFDALIRNA
jgi:geranylgeranyl diphosphate synthase, type II